MKDYNYLSSELCKLGLNKKEADVYLILLKLGYCSVQRIAEKLQLSRPTIYRILKNLEEKKLINTIQKGKRNYFIAGSPDALLNMLRVKKRKAKEQEREFLRIINTLQDQYSFTSNENLIETYSDNKISLAIEKLTNTQAQKIRIFSAESNTSITKAITEIHKRLGESFKVQQLQTNNSDIPNKKFIETKKLKISSILKNKTIIIADRVFIFKENHINIIKQKNVVESYELFFDSLWQNI